MPATGGKAPFGRPDPYRLDTTELPVTDDLYRPTGAIARAQALAAASSGAAHTLMLHGGSTAGMHAMLLYCLRRGDRVILPRNCHVSALHLCATAGIQPVFAEAVLEGVRPHTPLAAYAQAMERHPQAKALLVVRPDYYGLMPELEPLVALARKKGLWLLCDEAHGATYPWRTDVKGAISLGADMAVQSAHKTLPALTAGAWLHAGERVDVNRLRRILRMVQTSSPSFLTLLALDDARAWMDRWGRAACQGLLAALQDFYGKAQALGYAPGQGPAPPGHAFDPLRLVLQAPQGGYALGQALQDQGIDLELCDDRCIVGIVPLRGYQPLLRKLLRALGRIPATPAAEPQAPTGQSQAPTDHAPAPTGPPWPRQWPVRQTPLCEAAFAPCQGIPFPEAVGRVSAACVGLYPPGIALLTPGDLISQDWADFLAAQEPRRLFGLSEDGTLLCLAQR